ncbi:predicted protein [Phaeodactylum tricornutum CCAP 1055/1]|uniref:Flavin reductase like domain-containing protein n=2 Tax=Phaeodactylum tricornutum TaxID=2850 RepID=B7FT99_PHATC|nr:predicted protein [Phaeodactylum tricornutum CCAP 1055/1]EEC50619.1 predicted protein [Phaeodactylum tricornutum CCAP 1055/1]|eukprot:XP_002177805.1 predicted protein [Phaeodactylum tricornutum CCAP 1055/1]
MAVESDRLYWSVSKEDQSYAGTSDPAPPVRSLILPLFFDIWLYSGTLAWFSVDDDHIFLLEGYTAASYTPPTIIFPASTLPGKMWQTLLQTRTCTLSSATTRESTAVLKRALSGTEPKSFKFDELRLKASKNKKDYPFVVAESPIHMFCKVHELIALTNDEALVILTVETFVIDGSVLGPPTDEMTKRPNVTAKIDADLIEPVVSLGDGKVFPLMCLRSMPRPTRCAQRGSWTSTDFNNNVGRGDHSLAYETTEWSYRQHGGTCPLGYNATTALIMPRPIGWISTYSQEGNVAHLAPYSFFTDVSRGCEPIVAFSAFRKEGTIKKDAHKDAEEMKCFVYNMVDEDLAVKMNYSAAELGRNESEFELAKLTPGKARLVDAPVVSEAWIRLECEYFKTVEVDSFSVVLGFVRGIDIDRKLWKDGRLDVSLLKPITRLG